MLKQTTATVVLLAMGLLVGSPAVSQAQDEDPNQQWSNRWVKPADCRELVSQPKCVDQVQYQVYEDAPFQASPLIANGGSVVDCRCHGSSWANHCGRRGTLFQWSYGTSFSGGPDLDEPLVTDRPDFTEASSTVGKGVAQIEFGYTYTYNADNQTSERTNSWGEPLLRFGILDDWLEFRIALFPVDERTIGGGNSNTITGTEDLYVGFKIGLTPQEGGLPEMALIPQMNVPTGSSALTDDEVLPGLNWIYGWEISDFLSVAGSTQANRVVEEGSNQPYLEVAQSFTAAYSFTDEVGGYTEWFALFPHSADTTKPEYYFNGGLTLLLSNDVQFDIRAGLGLNNAADDFFAGTGLSIRFH